MATTTPPQAFRPFVPAADTRPELTVRAIIIGALFGILFGAVTVYVGLKAGLTVAASIPISVLSISILRVLGKSSILENNIVQTTGNAGQSIASGVIFTLPALIFLGFDLEYARIFALALFGGWIGVLFMIPLRRQLIVEEHGSLLYPEGTACADVLIAGERGGSFASRIFLGMGLGSLYTLFQNENLFGLWPSTPTANLDIGPQHLLKGGSVRADATPEYLGVGYIIGPRISGVMLAGGVFSWLVLMPAIYFFGSHLAAPLYPGTVPISAMSPSDLWRTYIRPMGAGAVAAAGCLTLLRTLPTIASALTGSLKAKKNKATTAASDQVARTSRDLPNSFVYGGSALIVLILWAFLEFKPVPGAQVGALANLAAALLVVVFGFLFVTVSARIVGIVGSSASPVSGMTIATLMATAAIFLVQGWTAPAFGALAITIGGVVCIAASNAGDTAQDLKTGYIIGATPWKTQLAVMIGVVVSTFVIGLTLTAMNKALESFHFVGSATPITVDLHHLPEGLQDKGIFPRPHIRLTGIAAGNGTADPALHTTPTGELNDATRFELINSIGSPILEDGKYLVDRATGRLQIQWVQGIGSEKAAAPQGRLMATVINGILTRKLPWSLVLLGVALVLAVELAGVRSLTLAVGAYLSIATTLAIFCGGLIRWLADAAIVKARARDKAIAAAKGMQQSNDATSRIGATTQTEAIASSAHPHTQTHAEAAAAQAAAYNAEHRLAFNEEGNFAAVSAVTGQPTIQSPTSIAPPDDPANAQHEASNRLAFNVEGNFAAVSAVTGIPTIEPPTSAEAAYAAATAPLTPSAAFDNTGDAASALHADATTRDSAITPYGNANTGDPGIAPYGTAAPDPIAPYGNAGTGDPVEPADQLTDLDNEEISPGSLFASGLIAAGGIMGLMGVVIRLLEGVSEGRGGNWLLPRFSENNPLHHDPVAIAAFAVLAFALYHFARKPLDTQ